MPRTLPLLGSRARTKNFARLFKGGGFAKGRAIYPRSVERGTLYPQGAFFLRHAEALVPKRVPPRGKPTTSEKVDETFDDAARGQRRDGARLWKDWVKASKKQEKSPAKRVRREFPRSNHAAPKLSSHALSRPVKAPPSLPARAPECNFRCAPPKARLPPVQTG